MKNSLGAMVAAAGVLGCVLGGCMQAKYMSRGMPLGPERVAEEAARGSVRSSPVAQRVMAAISPQRVRVDVDHLARFGTRHTLSDTTSQTRGIGAARRWIKGELDKAAQDSGGRMSVAFEEFDAPTSVRLPEGGRLVNVVATLRGSDEGARRYVVVAHYDSRNLDPMDAKGDAPGANDDGSGTAAVIEMARAMAGEELRSTVVFVLTAGEEQGLIGAKYHADEARARGERIAGVLNNDIVGDPSPSPGMDGPRRDREIRLFSEGVPRNPGAEELARVRSLAMEGDSPSRQVARFVVEVARAERTRVRPVLVFRPDRFLRGGDHLAFLDAGFPAVRFTEFGENYERQHQNVVEARDAHGRVVRGGDVPECVDAAYVADVARLNAAALVHLANGPAGPGNVRVLTAALAHDTDVRWEACAGAAGYEVVTRATTSAEWETVLDVGNVLGTRLAVSKDDVFVGVRAYASDGSRSVVVFAGAGKE